MPDASHASDAGRKGQFYVFDDSHDPCQPAQYFFQESVEGLTLFVVFYTLACRFRACAGCNLPSLSSSKQIGFRSIMAQADALFALPEVQERAGEIRKVIVSNNGSVLDEETFPTVALMYFIAQMRRKLPAVKMLSLESRVEYIDHDELDYLARALRERTESVALEIAIGVEAFNDTIRNGAFRKGLRLPNVRTLAGELARRHFGMKTYFMLKPVPEISDEAAILDIHRAIDFLDDVSRTTGCRINMHLNPTYAARGTVLGAAFTEGRFEPPRLEHAARAARHAEGKQITVHVGLSDEGLALPGGSFRREGDDRIFDCLSRFNSSGDYSALRGL